MVRSANEKVQTMASWATNNNIIMVHFFSSHSDKDNSEKIHRIQSASIDNNNSLYSIVITIIFVERRVAMLYALTYIDSRVAPNLTFSNSAEAEAEFG